MSIFITSHPREQAYAYLRAGLWNEALSCLFKLRQSEPDDPEIQIEIAKVYLRKEKPQECKKWLLQAARQKLNEPLTRSVLELTNHNKIASDRYFNAHPKFSPDGAWVIYSSAREDTNGDGKIDAYDNAAIFAVHADSGHEIRVSPADYFNSHPSFSSDMERVVFLSARKDTNGDGKLDYRDLPGLYYKDLISGREDCLVAPEHAPKFPSIAPDGKSVLFCAWHSGSKVCGIFLLDLKTRAIRALNDEFDSTFPLFSSDGKRVIFVGWNKDTNGDGRINLSDNSAIFELHLASGQMRELVSSASSNSYPAFSPDGTRIVFLSRRRDTNGDGALNSLDNSGIYLLHGGLDEELIASDEYYNKFPCFSHDGQDVLFIGSWRGKDQKESWGYFEDKGIYRAPLTQSPPQEIVSSKFYGSRDLCASPSAPRIAYVSWRKGSNRGLYVAHTRKLPDQVELIRLIESNL